MIFPGRKALMEEIPTGNIRVDDLISEFTNRNFSGYAEFRFPDSKGIILFHSGEIVTAIYKGESRVKSQEEGIAAIKNACRLQDGEISAYQLPGEMAHMLRGLCNREFLEEIHVPGKLKLLLAAREEENHTGTLDILFTQRKEKGMILLINGRVANTFLEMDKNLTLEGKEALDRIYELLDDGDGNCRIFKSDFSREIWKTRRGTRKPHESRIYEILTEREKMKESPLSSILRDFSRKVNNPPFTALLQEDGTILASASETEVPTDGEDPFNKFLTEASALFETTRLGTLKEVLCTSQEKNLLIRALPEKRCFHVLVMERKNLPRNLRKHLAELDREMAALEEKAVS